MQKPTIIYGEEKPTYYVIAEGGEAPKRSHKSRVSARNEAQRLARHNPGVKFSVVKLKDAFVFQPAGAVGGNERDRQVFARGNLHVGCRVEVKADHHASPGRTGTFQRFGDLAYKDTSVYVVLDGDGYETRFSPSSLIRIENRTGAEPEPETIRVSVEPEEEPAKTEDANPIGKLVAGLLGQALAAAVVRNLGDKTEDAADEPTPEDRSHMLRLFGLPEGATVGILCDTGILSVLGLAPPKVLAAKFLGFGEEPMTAMVHLTDEEQPRPVNLSRVYAIDDPVVLAILAEQFPAPAA